MHSSMHQLFCPGGRQRFDTAVDNSMHSSMHQLFCPGGRQRFKTAVDNSMHSSISCSARETGNALTQQ